MSSLAGGALIGSAAVLLLLAHGRIAGISGVLGSLLPPGPTDRGWRLGFLLGLALAGVVAAQVAPQAIGSSVRSTTAVLIAGVLVGFGTRMGGGCTSGHGVCGLSRLSPRSMIAVVTFMATGAITAIVAGGAS